MPTTQPTPEPTPAAPSNFTSRRAAREAAEAAGEVKPKWQSPTIRAGIDEPTPTLVVTHVRA